VARHGLRAEGVGWWRSSGFGVGVDGLGDGADHEGLGEPGDAHQQRVAAREDGHENLVEHVTLTDDAPRDLVAQPNGGGAQCVALRGL